MILKIRILIITMFLLSSVASVLVPVKTYALFEGSKKQACNGVNLTTSGGSCDPKKSGITLNEIITQAINLISIVVGIIAVIMIIVGGIKFVMSGGDTAATNSARNTVFYALIGLVVVFLAQILVRFVLHKVEQ